DQVIGSGGSFEDAMRAAASHGWSEGIYGNLAGAFPGSAGSFPKGDFGVFPGGGDFSTAEAARSPSAPGLSQHNLDAYSHYFNDPWMFNSYNAGTPFDLAYTEHYLGGPPSSGLSGGIDPSAAFAPPGPVGSIFSSPVDTTAGAFGGVTGGVPTSAPT